jgi:hypothetical protein
LKLVRASIRKLREINGFRRIENGCAELKRRRFPLRLRKKADSRREPALIRSTR